MFEKKISLGEKIRRTLLGGEKSLHDKNIFKHISLIAFFAWVGLGADGLSSSCYGPEEAFLALQGHNHLALIIALATALTVLIISSSYMQIIELFPSGGGGYLVASKLLSPTVGMVSGCALLIDYVLTIAISVASGADAIFSFLPMEMHVYKIHFALFGVLVLTVLNMRGVRESVLPLVPIFLVFIFTHVFAIGYAFFTQWGNLPSIAVQANEQIHSVQSSVGFWGLLFLIMRAYSMGAGTYTGIEAVSNGLPILREPRVQTGKRTMRYMAISLALTVAGLIMAYLLFNVSPAHGKTLNAILFENMTQGWGMPGHMFVWVTLFSEAMLLFVAAQAGFLDGPRVLANMAVDRWFPTRFAGLSDRLVTQNGILLMGATALITMILSGGSVRLLVILYSINVFITFCLSQMGMIRHWWRTRSQGWIQKITVNGVGFVLCFFILVSVTVLKFHHGGWVTLVVTGSLIALAVVIKRHYLGTMKQLHRLNNLVEAAHLTVKDIATTAAPEFDPTGKTAVILVNGYNGLGLHTLFNIQRFFGNGFKNFVFLQIGVMDAGNFKGVEEIDNLKAQIEKDIAHYIDFMHKQGKYASGMSAIGIDIMAEIEKAGPQIMEKYPNAVFFGGQLVFSEESFFTRLLHNYTVFAMQRRFYREGIPFVILPIRIESDEKIQAA